MAPEGVVQIEDPIALAIDNALPIGGVAIPVTAEQSDRLSSCVCPASRRRIVDCPRDAFGVEQLVVQDPGPVDGVEDTVRPQLTKAGIELEELRPKPEKGVEFIAVCFLRLQQRSQPGGMGFDEVTVRWALSRFQRSLSALPALASSSS